MKSESGQNSKLFIREFARLMDQSALKFNSRIWWSSDLASKNRFQSRICYCLQQNIYAPTSDLFRDILSGLKKKCAVVFHGSKIYLRAVLARHFLKKYIRLSFDQVYIIKSFVYNHSFDHGYHDTVFGRLPDYLKEKEKIVIFANVLGNFKYCLNKIRQQNDLPIIPIEFFLTFKEVWEAIRKLFFLKLRIDEDVIFQSHNIRDLMNRELLRKGNGIQIFQYLHYEATKNLLASFPAKCFLQTYENNPWEKMCILAVREQCPKAKIIGYQQTVVPQASVNMFPGKGEQAVAPFPDKVMTVGQIPEEILGEYGEYEEGYVRAACALGHEYLSEVITFPRKSEGKILVALEGVPEAHEMVTYVLGQLGGNDKFQVRIRTHPVLPWKTLSKKFGIHIDHLHNVEIAAGTTLAEDLKWADTVVYWGCTVALEAIKRGRPIIHYDNGSLLSFDPLFKNTHLKWTVTGRQSLIEVIDKIYDLNDSAFQAERQKAEGYINDYFWPVNNKNLAKFEPENLFDQTPAFR